jgi:hypothetical protein
MTLETNLSPIPQVDELEMEDSMHRRINVNQNDRNQDTSSQQGKIRNISMNTLIKRFKVIISLQYRKILLMLLVLFMVSIANFKHNKSIQTKELSRPKPNQSVEQQEQTKLKNTTAVVVEDSTLKSTSFPDLSKYDTCTFESPSGRDSWTTKPLWFPSYPNSIDDNLIKSLITFMTGLPAGAKSFYASSRKMGLRQCFGKTETAACLLIHPMVKMEPDALGKTDAFDIRLVYLFRNPATAIPAFLNGKRIKYAKIPGQTPIDSWRQSRDENFVGLWEQYQTQFTTWYNYTSTQNAYYRMAAYLSLEDIMDPELGPKSLERLADVLSEAGYPMVSKTNVPCIWYRAVGGQVALEKYNKQHHYEYPDYLPGYTKEQQQMFLDGLKQLSETCSDDTNLTRILNEYATTIKALPPDIPWVNVTQQK